VVERHGVTRHVPERHGEVREHDRT
jgi:hypothetical protein